MEPGGRPSTRRSVDQVSRPRRVIASCVLATLLILGGTFLATHRFASGSRGGDSPTAEALLHAAATFNSDYAANRANAVYNRWDAPSRSVISRPDYVRRHVECPASPGPATVEGASPGPRGYWLVRYSISGVQFVDYWHYVSRRWVFSLVLSNPGAVTLYRMAFSAYARAVGCTT